MICDERQTYQMRLVGHLDDRWSSWFEEFAIDRSADGTCTLTGPVTDQAQLHGILARLRDIGATLVSLSVIDADQSSSRAGEQAQLATSAHGSASIVDGELGVDALGVGAQRVE